MDDIIIGIGLLLFSNGRIMTVRELKSKPHYHKFAGMLSFPVETFDRNLDGDFRDTLLRLSKEELGMCQDEISILGIIPEALNPIPGRKDIDIYYGLAAFLGNPNKNFTPKDSDIQIIGWSKPETLYASNPVRVEVRPILDDFFSRKK